MDSGKNRVSFYYCETETTVDSHEDRDPSSPFHPHTSVPRKEVSTETLQMTENDTKY